MMKYRFKIFCMIFVLCCNFFEVAAQQVFRAVGYNVENLFDFRHDSLKNDTEYLPGNIRGWTSGRFYEKVNKIARVILTSSVSYAPDLVGLCEVENDYCLKTLVRYSPLREVGYRFVMTSSEDERGIDVALLYQPETFRLLESRSVRIPFREYGYKPTRDILHVAGRIATGDTLDVFVCHFPSRSGGVKASESFRMLAASCLRHEVDSIQEKRSSSYILVMGDFNDTPDDRALSEILRAGKPERLVEKGELYNLMRGKKNGTYCYRGEWSLFDQIIVSGTLLDKRSAIYTDTEKAVILEYPFLLEEDDVYGGDIPFRTYRGMRYHGGYSDHLPVAVDFMMVLP